MTSFSNQLTWLIGSFHNYNPLGNLSFLNFPKTYHRLPLIRKEKITLSIVVWMHSLVEDMFVVC